MESSGNNEWKGYRESMVLIHYIILWMYPQYTIYELLTSNQGKQRSAIFECCVKSERQDQNLWKLYQILTIFRPIDVLTKFTECIDELTR